jgi:hypothetical protein
MVMMTDEERQAAERSTSLDRIGDASLTLLADLRGKRVRIMNIVRSLDPDAAGAGVAEAEDATDAGATGFISKMRRLLDLEFEEMKRIDQLLSILEEHI